MTDNSKLSASRGAAYLMVTSLALLASGYVIHFVLGHFFGPETYGDFGVVLNLMTTINFLVTSGLPQSVSKYTAESGVGINNLFREANKVQLLFAAIIFAVYFGLANSLAGLLRDPDLVLLIRVSAVAVPIYAFYAIYSHGYLNGLRKFDKQAIAAVVVATTRIAFVLIFVLVGLGVNGAILGYIAAAALGLFIAWRYLGRVGKPVEAFKKSKLIKFAIPATLVSVIMYSLLNIDLFAVKRLVAEDAMVGYYTCATTLAKIPYFIFNGLALMLLPTISSSTSASDHILTRSYIRASLRYMILILLPLVLVISATSGTLITLFYPAEFIDAARPLSMLIIGLGLLAVFLVLANIIMGYGKPQIVLVIGLVMVVVDVLLNMMLIPRYELFGAALATTITASMGVVIAIIYIAVRFRTLIEVKSLLKIILASAIVYVIAQYVSVKPILLPLVYIGLVALYSGLLIVSKEIKRDDWEKAMKLLPFNIMDKSK